MEKFKTIDDILDFAIKSEQNAIEFYSKLSKETQNASMKEAYKEFILEEKSHREKLKNLKASGEVADVDEAKIADLKISDYIPNIEVHDNMDYRESLILAMQREKAAYKLYNDLAEIADNKNVKKLFYYLAAEEAKHKLKFEIEYDETILLEN